MSHWTLSNQQNLVVIETIKGNVENLCKLVQYDDLSILCINSRNIRQHIEKLKSLLELLNKKPQ